MTARADGSAPPGPPLPRWLQTLAFIVGPLRYIETCRRRYGEVVMFRSLSDPRFAMVFDPELVKQVFRSQPEELRAGEVLAAWIGPSSVHHVNGVEHRRLRRLLQPHFHGDRMRAHESTIRNAADRTIDLWPVGRPFALLPSMRSLAFEVIVRVVLGIDERARREEVKRRFRAMLDPVAPRLAVAAATLSRGRLGSSAAEHFRERRLRVDELVYEEIARRRTEPYLEAREDLLSALVLTRDEEGEPMSDSEIRDQLVSPIVAGFEGTAIAVSSILDLLLRHPSVLDRLRAELSGGDDAYLNAVIKEALRARTIVSGLGRKVAERPYELGGYVLRPGTEINPSIVAIHRRADLHPDPHEFRPERFLGPDPPDPHTWLPFGGGRRRCLGASFATFELGVVIRRVLERASLEPAGSRFRPSRRPFGHVVGPERRMRRGVVATPKGGALVLQRRRPVPATGSDPASTRALAAS